jgi:hypothetical protein
MIPASFEYHRPRSLNEAIAILASHGDDIRIVAGGHSLIHGQDGFRDKSSKQKSDLIEGHWKMRSVSRRGSIDHTICSLSCKFRPQLSTVAVELLPVSG